MSRIPSSLNNSDTAVNRNIDSSLYDNVKKVASVVDDILAIGEDLDLGDTSKIKIVSENIPSIDTTGSNIISIVSVAENMDKIVSLDSIKEDLQSATIIKDYINEIVIDANNIGSIVTVSNDLSLTGWSNLLDAGSISDNVTVEPSGQSYIKTTAENIEDVTLVGGSINSVVTVATNIADVNIVADNIVDIQNAEENANIASTKASEASTSASNALASKNLAHKWAQELEDVPVIGTVGIDDEYSAYHWAKKAESVAGGSITLDSLYDVDTSGITQGGLIRYDETAGWKAYDFTNNDKLGFDLAGSLISTGEMAWNPDEGTLDIGLNNGSVLQVGQENNRLVRNATGSTILNGTVVMFDGTVGNSGRVKVKPYTGVKGTEMYIYGVTTQDILSGSDGYITIEGKVRNINTTGSSVGETWLDGQVLYAKPNDSGRLTNIEPTDTEIKIEIATIINAHTNGTLEVRVVPIDRNFSYSRGDSDVRYLPLVGDFNLDLGGIV